MTLNKPGSNNHWNRRFWYSSTVWKLMWLIVASAWLAACAQTPNQPWFQQTSSKSWDGLNSSNDFWKVQVTQLSSWDYDKAWMLYSTDPNANINLWKASDFEGSKNFPWIKVQNGEILYNPSKTLEEFAKLDMIFSSDIEKKFSWMPSSVFNNFVLYINLQSWAENDSNIDMDKISIRTSSVIKNTQKLLTQYQNVVKKYWKAWYQVSHSWWKIFLTYVVEVWKMAKIQLPSFDANWNVVWISEYFPGEMLISEAHLNRISEFLDQFRSWLLKVQKDVDAQTKISSNKWQNQVGAKKPSNVSVSSNSSSIKYETYISDAQLRASAWYLYWLSSWDINKWFFTEMTVILSHMWAWMSMYVEKWSILERVAIAAWVEIWENGFLRADYWNYKKMEKYFFSMANKTIKDNPTQQWVSVSYEYSIWDREALLKEISVAVRHYWAESRDYWELAKITQTVWTIFDQWRVEGWLAWYKQQQLEITLSLDLGTLDKWEFFDGIRLDLSPRLERTTYDKLHWKWWNTNYWVWWQVRLTFLFNEKTNKIELFLDGSKVAWFRTWLKLSQKIWGWEIFLSIDKVLNPKNGNSKTPWITLWWSVDNTIIAQLLNKLLDPNTSEDEKDAIVAHYPDLFSVSWNNGKLEKLSAKDSATIRWYVSAFIVAEEKIHEIKIDTSQLGALWWITKNPDWSLKELKIDIWYNNLDASTFSMSLNGVTYSNVTWKPYNITYSWWVIVITGFEKLPTWTYDIIAKNNNTWLYIATTQTIDYWSTELISRYANVIDDLSEWDAIKFKNKQLSYATLSGMTTPSAPNVTADDAGNTITWWNSSTMELAVSTDGWTTYPDYSSPSSLPDLSWNKKVKVRYKTVSWVSKPSSATVLTFTTNPIWDTEKPAITSFSASDWDSSNWTWITWKTNSRLVNITRAWTDNVWMTWWFYSTSSTVPAAWDAWWTTWTTFMLPNIDWDYTLYGHWKDAAWNVSLTASYNITLDRTNDSTNKLFTQVNKWDPINQTINFEEPVKITNVTWDTSDITLWLTWSYISSYNFTSTWLSMAKTYTITATTEDRAWTTKNITISIQVNEWV